MTSGTKIKVQGERGEWILVSERSGNTEAMTADLNRRGWKNWATIRRANGRREYIALITADGRASIIA